MVCLQFGHQTVGANCKIPCRASEPVRCFHIPECTCQTHKSFSNNVILRWRRRKEIYIDVATGYRDGGGEALMLKLDCDAQGEALEVEARIEKRATMMGGSAM